MHIRLVTSFDNFDTLVEGIANGSRWAHANGIMIDNGAFGFGRTNAWARVHTFLSVARSVHRAIGVTKTFRTAAVVRISMVVGNTFADAVVVLDATPSVNSTRRWVTRVPFNRWW